MVLFLLVLVSAFCFGVCPPSPDVSLELESETVSKVGREFRRADLMIFIPVNTRDLVSVSSLRTEFRVSHAREDLHRVKVKIVNLSPNEVEDAYLIQEGRVVDLLPTDVNYPTSEMRSFVVGLHPLWGALPPRAGSLRPYSCPAKGRAYGDTFGQVELLSTPSLFFYPTLKSPSSLSGAVGYLSYLPICSTNAFWSTPSGRAVSPHHRYGVLARKFLYKIKQYEGNNR
ncbi:MAG: hypothetical protein Q9N26_05800 [Aquificota bacterium]|nr:hypothetical protein [Aquificota bacterium]